MYNYRTSQVTERQISEHRNSESKKLPTLQIVGQTYEQEHKNGHGLRHTLPVSHVHVHVYVHVHMQINLLFKK
jgi:hypothetical protein